MIGQTLDHYRIVAQLGEGGMGVVYRARDEVLNRDVALKLLAQGALDRVGSGHLLREAQTASSLSHPNICTIHQVGQTGDDFYVVMELIEGRAFSDLLGATGLSMETVTRYGAQIADALAHAHDRGIVHRDLKGDRKSTRLNSSHPSISYAVFCLKKKTAHTRTAARPLMAKRSRRRFR